MGFTLKPTRLASALCMPYQPRSTTAVMAVGPAPFRIGNGALRVAGPVVAGGTFKVDFLGAQMSSALKGERLAAAHLVATVTRTLRTQAHEGLFLEQDSLRFALGSDARPQAAQVSLPDSAIEVKLDFVAFGERGAEHKETFTMPVGLSAGMPRGLVRPSALSPQNFPRLRDFKVVGPPTIAYECLDLALSYPHRFGTEIAAVTLADFSSEVAQFGYRAVSPAKWSDRGLQQAARNQPGTQKLALFMKRGVVTHMAVQLADGRWLSKLTHDEAITTRDLHELSGGTYGEVARIWQRPRPQHESLP